MPAAVHHFHADTPGPTTISPGFPCSIANHLLNTCISQALFVDSDGLQTGSDPVPNLYLSLSNASDYSPCIAGGGQVSLQDLEANITASLGKATDGPYGLIELSALFQNPGLQECAPYLGGVTAIYFYTTDVVAVSFCLADMSLLPPTIPSSKRMHFCHHVCLLVSACMDTNVSCCTNLVQSATWPRHNCW